MQAAALEDAGGLADEKRVSPTELGDSSPAPPIRSFSPSLLPQLLPFAAGRDDENVLNRPELHAMSPALSSPVVAAGQQTDVASPAINIKTETELTFKMPEGLHNKQAEGRGNVQGQCSSHLGKRTLQAAELQV